MKSQQAGPCPFATEHIAGRAGVQTLRPLRRNLFCMNWDRIRGRWKLLKRRVRQRSTRQTREQQLADWLAREHKADPIHK